MNPANAYMVVARAIKKGKLKKLDGTVSCVDCDEIATAYDHRDYNLPLMVEPVCSKCNVARGHGLNRSVISSQLRMPMDLADGCQVLQDRLQISANAARILAMATGLKALGVKV